MGAFHGSQSLSLRGKGEGKWGAGGDVDELAALGELVDLGAPEEALVVGPEGRGGGARGPKAGGTPRWGGDVTHKGMWEDQASIKTRGGPARTHPRGSWPGVPKNRG